MNQEKLRALYSSIVALGYIIPNENGGVTLPDNFKIIGTGIVVSDDLILTNRHVVGQLESINTAPENKIWLSFDSFGATHNILGYEYTTSYVPPFDADDTNSLKKGHTDLRIHILDVGFLQIKADLLGEKFYKGNKIDRPERHIKFSDLQNVHLGQKIGIIGFLLGDVNQKISLSDPSGFRQEFVKFGPLLHSGIISGFAPNNAHWYEYSVRENVSQIITDLSVGAGLSGAPVFDWESLEIIGIHFASHREERQLGSIGFTIPLTIERVEHLALLSIAHKKGIPIPDGENHLHGKLSPERMELIYSVAGIDRIC